MSDDVASRKAPRAGVQAVAAVVMVAGAVGGAWGLAEALPDQSEDRGPAACSSDTHHALPSKYVSGAKLCTALNRSDLPALLGTPDEQAETADPSGGWITLADGTKIAAPEATVTFETYSVKLSDSYDGLSVGATARLLGKDAESRTVLGHPAVLHSDRTIGFTINGGKVGTGPGGIARSLLVAKGAKDGGGSFAISIWRQDDVPPDDTALFRIAEKVLPTVPGWRAG
ncbi:DUF6215 domain-containing protein [Streptomyces sp. NPDC002671]